MKMIHESFLSHSFLSLPMELRSLTLLERPLQLIEMILGGPWLAGPGLASTPPRIKRIKITEATLNGIFFCCLYNTESEAERWFSDFSP